MPAWIRWLLTVQASKPNQQRRAHMIIILSLGLIGVAIAALPVTVLSQGTTFSFPLALVCIGLLFGIIALARRGKPIAGTALMVLLVVAPFAAELGTGFIGFIPFVYILSIVVASLILRPRSIWFVLIADFALIGLASALLPFVSSSPIDEDDIASLFGGFLLLPMVALIGFLGASTIERQVKDLRHAIEKAEAANRAKSTFLATMSHELRTPLTAILGYTQLMQLQSSLLPKPAFTEELERIEFASIHLRRLIDDVLSLASLEADQLKLHIDVLDVDAVVAEVSALLRPQFAQRQNQFHADVSPDIGVIYCDVERFRQILTNILSNATKFSERGRIQLAAHTITANEAQALFLARGHKRDVRSERSAWLVCTVADSGIGMSTDKLANIFQPFVQLDASPTRQYGGAGLGLTISQRLCQLMGGEIFVDSEVGVGSTFTVLLPVQSNSDSKQTEQTMITHHMPFSAD